MKVVINVCHGGFSLSPKAVRYYAQLQGRECYFYETKLDGDFSLELLSEEQASKIYTDPIAFDVPDMDARYAEACSADQIAGNRVWKQHYLDDRPEDRSDPLLIQVVEELGDQAAGKYAQLKVVEIPDDVKWYIDEYDGWEHIAENHRTWA